jgi:hypothetical protein
MHIIGVAYAMTQAIIGKYVIINNVLMTKQIFSQIYYDIFLKHIKLI